MNREWPFYEINFGLMVQQCCASCEKRKKSKFYYMLDIFVILEQNFKFLATVLFVLSRSS